MALKKTQLLDITSVTGIATVSILTVGVTPTAGGVGVASTSYIKNVCLLYTSPSPRDQRGSRMPSSA